ncbi:type II secretion system protein GspL [Chitinimonas sp.]|uniref:type II secretion system protein GspL n=1 Tax=Chitinimonas sp. TaxID=1934313 RepID=UPI002F95E7B9
MTTLRLFITESSLPATAATEVEWRLLDGQQVSQGRSTLQSLPAAGRLELFLPPARVLRATVSLPPGARRQAGKLLPYALDQVLLTEPSEQHLAHRIEDERCLVAAVQKEAFAELLNTLGQLGRRPRSVWSADMLIPADGQSLMWYGNGWARRTADTAQWFDATDPQQPPELLALALPEAEPLTLALPARQTSAPELGAWQSTLARPVSLAAGDVLARPIAPDAIDLLQGEFAAGPQLDLDWSRLRASAVLAGAMLAIGGLLWLGQWWSWRSEEAALKQQIRTAYSRAFPKEPMVDPVLQLQAKLRSQSPGTPAGNGSDSLGKLMDLAPRLATGGGIKLLSLDYLNGRIEAEYQAKPEQLAGLAQALSQLGKVDSRPSAADRTRITLTPNS